ncbi:SRPBCC family protein [Streptomyces avidinii]|uniref:SRPBCC family protein n=1 Tax=Streptomyces avidinii TaxID=1895 RepID=UPI00386DF9C3|nr:SRPBCC family protein [Streptomyces avidinii]
MKVDVLAEAVIAASCGHVAACAADPANAPEWYSNITSVDWLTPPPVAVGSKVAFVARFLGRRLAYTYEITAYEPGRRMVMRTAQGPFPMETTYTWEPYGEDADRTRMTPPQSGRAQRVRLDRRRRDGGGHTARAAQGPGSPQGAPGGAPLNADLTWAEGLRRRLWPS